MKGGKWTRLGSDLSQALAEYARLIRSPTGAMDDLVDAALAVRGAKLAKNTLRQYEVAAHKIKHMLQDLTPDQVLPRHIAQLKVSLAKTPNMANRVLSVLRVIFDYALEQQLVDSNPAIGVRRYKEHERERLITEDEYRAIYHAAGARLQVIMDLCYLTGQRIGDVLSIRYADLGDDGIGFRQRKTNARLTLRWTPELRAAVKTAMALHGNVRALTLLHNRRGKPPDYKTTHEQWNAACAAAGIPDAHMHDLRAMSGTAADAQGLDAQKLLGHTSAQNTRRYLRSKKVPTVDGPSFGRAKSAGKKA